MPIQFPQHRLTADSCLQAGGDSCLKMIVMIVTRLIYGYSGGDNSYSFVTSLFLGRVTVPKRINLLFLGLYMHHKESILPSFKKNLG